MSRSSRRSAFTAMCMVVGTLLASCSSGTQAAHKSPPHASGDPSKPNIVYVLTDDLDWNLLAYMPHVQQMAENGTTFRNYFVTDSLCCPSRSSIFTGQYPHNTGVFTNGGPDGGFGAFMKNHNERKSFGPALQRLGYRTGFMGKYLNGYVPTDTHRTSKPYVPKGWDEWDVAGNGYPEFDYALNENGKIAYHAHDPKDYLPDVMSRKATQFISSSAESQKPFMLELATFTPHLPATPAPRHARTFLGLKAPRTEAFGRTSAHAPPWQRELAPLSPKEVRRIDRIFAKRVRSVQAIDEMIGQLQSALQANGVADNTYLVFGSDNGFHMGEHRLRPGKKTPYDTDIKVPMVVTGPGVSPGAQVAQLAENIDINPTFQELAGGRPPATVDGRSLAGLLHGRPEQDWRQAVLVEHHKVAPSPNDPDVAPPNAGDPPDYEALRTLDSLYVEYADGEREYYSMRSDPSQLDNRWAALPPSARALLHETLTALKTCKGAERCSNASRTTPKAIP